MQSTHTPNRPGRQSDQTAARTKEAIVGAALSEFAEHGFEGASLRTIAQRAGTTHGLIRHHFGSKEEVFRACVDQAMRVYGHGEKSIIQGLSAQQLSDPRALIEAHKEIMRNFARVSAQNPLFMRILLHEGGKQSERLNYIYQQVELLNAQHQQFFSHLMKTGALRQFDPNSCFLFILLNLGLAFGLSAVSSHFLGGNILDQAHVEAHIERILQTLYPS
ncbi:MAG: TetR/AcrR family transcriptional regulator [Meiothermus sp.]|nr:TetR/AcrR family transcriptional regulator [Meiothermus sp.]